MAGADDILSGALELPSEQRARLAKALLLGLGDEEDPDAEAEWDTELGRRAQDVLTGRVKGVSLDEVRRVVADRLSRVREGIVR
jgi:putative addiction module component (TIGR02574 family)